MSSKIDKFNLNKYLYIKKKIIDTALDKYLPKESVYPDSIHRAMRYSLFAGGKRLRGVLVIAGKETFAPGKFIDVLPVACAVEMIHTYSLIHDDLPCIDNDDLRRGKPTSHKVFGEAIAVLAGDALLTCAFHTISRSKKIKPEVLLKVIHIISEAVSTYGMIGGQVVDIETSGKKIDSKILEYIHNCKTGTFLQACVSAGAIMGGANDDELKHISIYGKNIGLAFQIVDDILDVLGDTRILGKTAGSDIINKKNTYPEIFGIEKSRKKLDKLIDNAINEADKFDTGGIVLKEIAKFIRDRKL
ncbi:polyprenyl synthetase family protein [Candidatus Poribacteria bacterium]|nr:polyprenyl synthetase family protein [Candidatus Poribacteria bacterium]